MLHLKKNFLFYIIVDLAVKNQAKELKGLLGSLTFLLGSTIHLHPRSSYSICSRTNQLYQPLVAAVTKCHQLGSKQQKSNFSHSSGGQKLELVSLGSEIRVLGQQHFLLKLQWRIYSWPLLPGSCGCWHSLTHGNITPISASLVTLPHSLLSIVSLPLPAFNDDAHDCIQGPPGQSENSPHLKICKVCFAIGRQYSQVTDVGSWQFFF